jgi:enediyne biosynthesis protein E5
MERSKTVTAEPVAGRISARVTSAPPPAPVLERRSAPRPRVRRALDTRLAALRRFALSITIFNVAGHLFLGFEQSPVTPVVAVITAYAVELLLERVDSLVHRRSPRFAGGFVPLVHFLLPAHIAGLACAMLLYGNASVFPTMFAVTAGIAAKHVVKAKVGNRWRHVLNPSNAGISLTLILFPWVGIAPPYHFTSNVGALVDVLLPLGIIAAGTALNATLTRRTPLILAWMGGFVGQALVRELLFDQRFLAALLPMTGVAFVLFTNYMLPDPGTTPISTRGQIVFGLTAATTYGLLMTAHVVFGLFFALTITCALRALVLHLHAMRPETERTPCPSPSPS